MSIFLRKPGTCKRLKRN